MPLRSIGRALERLELRGRHLLVAASAGLDSTALLHLLLTLRSRFELALSVGHVDHGLRGEASQADARFVHELATGLGLRAECEQIDLRSAREGHVSRQRPTLQEAARRLRYAALLQMADRVGADVVATAHTLDDQAETVLLRLLRGTGPDGLGGIPERAPGGRVVRPLLEVSRAELESWAREHGLRWREDASNLSDEYARNRLRRHWLPGLARDFNPRLLRAIGNLAEAQRRDAEWIAAAVAREARERIRRSGDVLTIARRGWEALPEALARRLVRECLAELGGGREVSRVHLERMLAFLRSEGGAASGRVLELPGGLRLARERDGFRLYRAASTEPTRKATDLHARFAFEK